MPASRSGRAKAKDAAGAARAWRPTAALVRSMSDRKREARAEAVAEQAAAEGEEAAPSAELSAVRESVMSLRRPEGLEELWESPCRGALEAVKEL